MRKAAPGENLFTVVTTFPFDAVDEFIDGVEGFEGGGDGGVERVDDVFLEGFTSIVVPFGLDGLEPHAQLLHGVVE